MSDDKIGHRWVNQTSGGRNWDASGFSADKQGAEVVMLRREVAIILAALLLINVTVGGTAWVVRASAISHRATLDLTKQLNAIRMWMSSPAPLDNSTLENLSANIGAAQRDLTMLESSVPLRGVLPGPGQGSLQQSLSFGSEELVAAKLLVQTAIILRPGLRYVLAQVLQEAPPPPPIATPFTLDTIRAAQLDIRMANQACDAAASQEPALDSGSGGSNVSTGNTPVQALLAYSISSFSTLKPLCTLFGGIVNQLPGLLGFTEPNDKILLLYMDTDQARPDGGSIGAYGLLSFANATPQGEIIMHDTHSLDCKLPCGLDSPPPDYYQWFEGSGIPFGLQNSGLSPNFPTSASVAANVLLAQESSPTAPQHILETIAVTPRVAQQILSVIGPVRLTSGIGTIRADNLLTSASYWHNLALSGTSLGGAPAPAFDVVLAQAITASMAHATTAQLRQIGNYLLQDLASGDVQISGSAIEQELSALNWAGSVAHFMSDSLFVTNTNLSQNYDSPDLVETVTDKITLDPHGQAEHTLTLTYTYRPTLALNAASTYSDVVTVVVPEWATAPTDASATCAPISIAVSKSVSYSCLLNLIPNQTLTLNLSWTTSAVSGTTGNGMYALYVQRQPGEDPQTRISISVPPGTQLVAVSPGGHTSQGQGEWFTPSLLSNEILTVRWISQANRP